MALQGNRLSYIDCIRGFSMLMVVYHHILFFSFQHYGVDGYQSLIDEIVITFRMPLFFFISGFVSYKRNNNWTKEYLKDKLQKKLYGQFIPTVVMLGVFCLTHGISYVSALEMPSKSGYWFTYVSFIIYSLWVLCAYTMHDIKNRWTIILYTTTPIAIISTFFLVYIGADKEYLSHLLSLGLASKYALFFLLGIVSRRYVDTLNMLLSNKWVTLVVFIWAIYPITINSLSGYWDSCVNTFLIGIPRVLLIYTIFYFWKDFLDQTNTFSKGLKTIGKHTLEIYFLHYFLLFRIDPLASWFTSLTSDACNFGSSSLIIPELIILIISGLICYTCIIIKQIIDAVPIVSTLCFGPTKHTTHENSNSNIR